MAKESTVTKVFALIGIIAIVPVLIVFGGWALSVVWGWVAVPIFGLPVLSVSHGVAVSALASMLRSRQPEPKKPDESELEHTFRLLFGCIIGVFIAMLIAWCAK